MPQLIQLRQRIKAVDTIQKITHAMQLIAMSMHLRLRDAKDKLDLYYAETKSLYDSLHVHVPGWLNSRFYPAATTHNELIIIIGSQKGLCGPFNINLFSTFASTISDYKLSETSVVMIGKKATEYFQHRMPSIPVPLKVVRSFDDLTEKSASFITQELSSMLLHAELPYTRVLVYSSYPATFFMPRQQVTTLLPFTDSTHISSTREPIYWQDDPHLIMDACAELYLNSSIYYLLMQSLIAEQASRFVSMDSATRNAKKLREAMLLSYNKLRQAKITKEITELSSGFYANIGT